MAEFTGTIKEFNNFIGGYTRNKAQNISKKYKKKIGKCEACGSRTKKLEAAHVHGMERPKITAQILQNYTEENIVNINLHAFEEQYLESHKPIEEIIKVLCKPCHREYDNSKTKVDSVKIKADQEIENILNAPKLSKKHSIELLKKNGIDNLINSNTVFSNVNKAIDVYWLEPDNNKFSKDFNIILNDFVNRKLNLFTIRGNSIKSPELIFDQRSDRNSSKIIIDSTKNDFIEKKGFEFNQFLVKSIEYNISDQN